MMLRNTFSQWDTIFYLAWLALITHFRTKVVGIKYFRLNLLSIPCIRFVTEKACHAHIYTLLPQTIIHCINNCVSARVEKFARWFRWYLFITIIHRYNKWQWYLIYNGTTWWEANILLSPRVQKKMNYKHRKIMSSSI